MRCNLKKHTHTEIATPFINYNHIIWKYVQNSPPFTAKPSMHKPTQIEVLKLFNPKPTQIEVLMHVPLFSTHRVRSD